MNHEPTEEIDRSITVELCYTHNVEFIKTDSVQEAVDEVKKTNGDGKTPSASRIIIDGEDVYYSEVHGDIDVWESHWKQEMCRMSAEGSARDCPNDNVHCFKNDLCIECQFDAAAKGVVGE